MTRYQIILAPRNDAEIDNNCPSNANLIKKDRGIMTARAKKDAKLLLKTAKNSEKRAEQNALINVHYLFDDDSVAALIAKLNDGDTLVIHGEGNPFIIGVGLAPCEAYDLKAIDLANRLKRILPQDKQLTVEILACLSAVDYEDPKFSFIRENIKYKLNFAQNTSLFLGPEYPFVDIVGFTGNVVEPKGNSGKYTISAYTDEEVEKDQQDNSIPRIEKKVQKNSSIAQAKRVYNNGVLQDDNHARVLREAKAGEFGGWAKQYKDNAFQALNQFLALKMQASLSGASLFAAVSATDITENVGLETDTTETVNPSSVPAMSG